MNSDNPNLVGHCPECGALNRAVDQVCWLCECSLRRLDRNPIETELDTAIESKQRQPAATSFQNVEFVREYSHNRFHFTLMSLFLLVTLIAIGLGTWNIWPQFSGALLLIGCPSALATMTRSFRQEMQNKEMNLVDKVITFFVSSIVIFTILTTAFIVISVVVFIHGCLECVDNVIPRSGGR